MSTSSIIAGLRLLPSYCGGGAAGSAAGVGVGCGVGRGRGFGLNGEDE
jgi:hypothetical protein